MPESSPRPVLHGCGPRIVNHPENFIDERRRYSLYSLEVQNHLGFGSDSGFNLLSQNRRRLACHENFSLQEMGDLYRLHR